MRGQWYRRVGKSENVSLAPTCQTNCASYHLYCAQLSLHFLRGAPNVNHRRPAAAIASSSERSPLPPCAQCVRWSDGIDHWRPGRQCAAPWTRATPSPQHGTQSRFAPPDKRPGGGKPNRKQQPPSGQLLRINHVLQRTRSCGPLAPPGSNPLPPVAIKYVSPAQGVN